MTEYIVLFQSEEITDEWREMGQIAARSDISAIRRYLDAEGFDGDKDKYVAVPKRSFRVRYPKSKTKTTISFK